MYFAFGRWRCLPLGIVVTAYVVGIAFALGVAAQGVWRLAEAGVQRLPASSAGARSGADRPQQQAGGDEGIGVQEGRMRPLADRSDAASDRAQPPSHRSERLAQLFGGSDRRPFRRFGEDDDDRESRPEGADRPATYRTVCVRLCDGYYFPISFSVSADRLARDKAVCESRCGGQGRLFVQRSPGGSADDLRDLAGQPYSKLPGAFRYRSEYVASCKCQPDPWEAAALERHRLYALAAAARKGDKAAAKELAEKSRDDPKAAAAATSTAATPQPDPAAIAASLAKAREVAGREGGNYMRLGNEGEPKPKSGASPPRLQGEAEWVKRIFTPGAMR